MIDIDFTLSDIIAASVLLPWVWWHMLVAAAGEVLAEILRVMAGRPGEA